MAATVSGAKTVTTDLSPYLTAAALTTILAIAPENMTIAQLDTLVRATKRTPLGTVSSNTLGTVLI